MATEQIEWGTPPESQPRYGEFYEALKERPGEWARYPGSLSSAYQYAERHEDYEAKSTGTLGEQVGWMRYVGDSTSDA